MTRTASPWLGAIELGGTKVICAVGTANGIASQCRIATGSPGAAIAEIGAFFDAAATRFGPIAAVGVASFGPLDLNPASPHFGALTTTPKPGWGGFALRETLGERLAVPVAIETDVNAAALAEAYESDGLLAYVTVGTGIGVGVANRRGVVRGARHLEAGHIRPRRHPLHGGFAGICPYHGDCLEGLASGPAIIAAWGASLDRLASDHPARAVEADAIGQLCAAIALMLAPDRIVLGGGVMAQLDLLPLVRAQTSQWLGGYVAGLDSAAALEAYLRPASLDASGLIGAFRLAAHAVGS